MRLTWVIFKREFLGYFRLPVAYVFLAVFLMASVGLPWFVGDFFESNEASLRLFFVFIPWVYLFLIPAVGMRLWAEEKHAGTWELLLTLPVHVREAVLGKWLAGWSFVGLALILTGGMPLTVIYLGKPDIGVMLAGYWGAFLMAGAYLSLCALSSSLTKSQVVSFVAGGLGCLVLVLLGWSVFNDLLLAAGLPVWLVDTIANFGFIPHFNPMIQGLLTLADTVYFISVIAVCLGINILVLERR